MKRIFIISIVFSLSTSAHAAFGASVRSHVKKGNEFYQQGNFEASAEKYNEALEKKPESDVVNFDLGTALYKKGDYDQAIAHMQKALLTENKDLKQKTYYNLGNGLYKNGVAREEKDLNFAVDSLQKSLKQYEQALSFKADDQDAKFNYEFVKKELERLQKKQQEQQKDQQNQKQTDNKQQQSQQNQENQKNQDSQQNQKQEKNQQSEQSQGNQQNQQNPSEQQANQSEQKQSQGEQNQEQKTQQEKEKDQEQQAKPQEQEGAEQSKQDQASSTNNPQTQPAQNEYNSEQGQAKDSQQLTEKEAQMLMDRYRQREEPKGLLNLQVKRKEMAPVSKDW